MALNRATNTLVAIALATAMVSAGCGNRSSREDIGAAAKESGTGVRAGADVGSRVDAAPTPAPEVATADGAESGATATSAEPLGGGERAASSKPGTKSAASGARAGSGTAPAGGGGTAAKAANAGALSGSGGTPGEAAPGPVGGGGAQAAAGCSSEKAPIIIGTVGTQSGIVGAAVIGGVKAVQAWVATQNARGGLDCHPVKYLVADDGGDPTRHQALVKQLVEQEKIIGIVYMDAILSGQASVEYLQRMQVPVMGSETGSMFFRDSPMHFPLGSNGYDNVDLTAFIGAKMTVPQGKKKVATITCQEATFCNVADERWAQLAPRLGWEVVYRGKASLTQPDFSSFCLSAQSAGAQVIIGAQDPNGFRRIASSCARVGFHPTLSLTSLQSNLSFQDDPNMDGAVISQPVLPWFFDAEPAIREYQAVLREHAPNLPLDAATVVGWASAKLFERAARGRLSDPPTSRDLLQGLWTMKNETLGGLIPPMTFTEGQPAPSLVCGWAMVVKGKRITSDGKLDCLK